eukprot:3939913-Pyramimonas_sp.AAC.1
MARDEAGSCFACKCLHVSPPESALLSACSISPPSLAFPGPVPSWATGRRRRDDSTGDDDDERRRRRRRRRLPSPSVFAPDTHPLPLASAQFLRLPSLSYSPVLSSKRRLCAATSTATMSWVTSTGGRRHAPRPSSTRLPVSEIHAPLSIQGRHFSGHSQ